MADIGKPSAKIVVPIQADDDDVIALRQVICAYKQVREVGYSDLGPHGKSLMIHFESGVPFEEYDELVSFASKSAHNLVYDTN